MTAQDIIIRPVLTEKSNDGVAAKRYVFMVDPRADKVQVKAAVESIFDVKVESVNVTNVRGKLKRQGRTQGYTSKGKKAYVTLTPDSKAIPFFETLS
ncbi:MAG: 50S ribosomal protein L23 [Clostridiales bacterium]|nr:50S ribosomal protein L23 [Clostridiales bacterium]